jgi:hypothetical protein
VFSLCAFALVLCAAALSMHREVTRRAQEPRLERFVGSWPPPTPTSPLVTDASYTNPVGIQFVRVPAPPPLPGVRPCPPDPADAPCHFLFVSQREISQREWFAVSGFNSSTDVGPDLPVHNVDFMEARGFYTAMRSLDGGLYRLPSAYEWDWLVRAGAIDGATEPGPWCPSDCEPPPKNTALEPSASPAHPWGLLDLCGSLSEWTAVDEDPATFARALATQSAPIRGRSPWSPTRRLCAPDAREEVDFFHKSRDIGLRLILEPRP